MRNKTLALKTFLIKNKFCYNTIWLTKMELQVFLGNNWIDIFLYKSLLYAYIEK